MASKQVQGVGLSMVFKQWWSMALNALVTTNDNVQSESTTQNKLDQIPLGHHGNGRCQQVVRFTSNLPTGGYHIVQMEFELEGWG